MTIRSRNPKLLAETTNDKLIKSLRKHYKIKNHGVKTAPFYVLRFTTMPSILAEVGFISNSAEEKRLRTTTFQKKLAEGIYRGHSIIPEGTVSVHSFTGRRKTGNDRRHA